MDSRVRSQTRRYQDFLSRVWAGHLVLTTLHTNDSIATLSRLKDMGVEPFKIALGLLSVSAQRLARRLCDQCRHAVASAEIDAKLLAALLRRALESANFIAKPFKPSVVVARVNALFRRAA